MPLSVEFTEQAETIPCARASCQKLVPRFQLQEVISQENGMMSRFVCPSCYKYYDRKTAAVAGNARASASAFEPSQEIRAGANLAQRSSTNGIAPPVRAIGSGISNSQQPSSRPFSMSRGPPISVQGNRLEYSGEFQTQGLGYSLAHNHLSQQFSRFEARGQQLHRSQDTFPLTVKLAYWSDHEGKVIIINPVTETCGQVDMHIGYIELRSLTISTISARLTAWLSGYTLNLESLELRDKDYIIIRQSSRDCIQHYFVTSTTSKGIAKLKSKKLELRLIMPYTTFLEIEEYFDASIRNAHSTSVTSTSQDGGPQSRKTPMVRTLKEQAMTKAQGKGKGKRKGKGKGKEKAFLALRNESDGRSSDSESSELDIALITSAPKKTKIIHNPPQTEPDSGRTVIDLEDPPASQPSMITLAMEKLSPFRPGTKRKATDLDRSEEADQETEIDIPGSPDFSLLDDALRQQADPTDAMIKAALPDGSIFVAEVFLLPKKRLEELLLKPSISPSQFKSGGLLGTLTVNLKQTIGSLRGSFKTTHLGLVQPYGTDVRCGFPWNMNIAIKRPYYTEEPSASVFKRGRRSKPTMQRYAYGKEIQDITQELRCLVWGDVLMDLVYRFIEQEVKQRGKPPFLIPTMRFVRFGVIVTRGTETIGLLAEELIEGNYMKYMDNRVPVPFEDITDPDALHRANFLVFAQHVQWKKTEGKVFVTDFQGNDSLLTDPQILTHPRFGVNLFGHGNIAGSFINFPKQHICNEFCEFFELGEPLTLQLDTEANNDNSVEEETI